jgi:hypothetical protein
MGAGSRRLTMPRPGRRSSEEELMRSHQNVRAVLLAAFAAGAASPALAAVGPLPSTHNGNVAYVTGGFGSNERHALEKTAKDYNLEITNAIKDGEMTAGTDLAIQSAKGRSVLRVADTGPLFYAKLPPGRYTIHATNGKENRVRDVSISAKRPADIHLIWHQMG